MFLIISCKKKKCREDRFKKNQKKSSRKINFELHAAACKFARKISKRFKI